MNTFTDTDVHSGHSQPVWAAFAIIVDTRRESPTAAVRKTLLRRLWLPRAAYEALPYAYLCLGIAALASGIFLPDGRWMLAYLALLSAALLHGGVLVFAVRRRYRRRSLQRSRATRRAAAH